VGREGDCRRDAETPEQETKIRLSRARAIVYGGLAVGLLDIADAIIFFGIRNGAARSWPEW
jgi:hypothetical protein